jgi:hypothetical protein
MSGKVEAMERTVQGMPLTCVVCLWMLTGTGLQHFLAVHNANLLIDSLVTDFPTSEEVLRVARESHARLSFKDQWENNGIVEVLSEWSSSERASLLWVGGQCGNQDSWVTQFSADLVAALRSQKSDITVAHAFFDCTPDRLLTATDFVKVTIARIIEERPVTVVELPELLNTRLLRPKSTFAQCWLVLEGLIDCLSGFFLVLDRVDAGADNEHGLPVAEELLPKLLGLVSKCPDKVKIIITSAEEPPNACQGNSLLSSVWLDTGTRQIERGRR